MSRMVHSLTFVITKLPFYALISFACFLLARLGWAVLTFNDVPEAHESLQREIETAKAELRKVNVDVD
jgi:dolichyl-phosphate mannosyltransferase polypeptide 3